MRHVGNISNHFDAMHHTLAVRRCPDDAPYIGSILSKVRPTPCNVVSYVWLFNPGRASVFISAHIATGGYLGAKHAPMFIGDTNNHPAMPALSRAGGICSPRSIPDRLEDRRNLLQALNSRDRLGNRAGRDWSDLQQKAFELVNGPGGRQVFEVDRESDREYAIAMAGIPWANICCSPGDWSKPVSAVST